MTLRTDIIRLERLINDTKRLPSELNILPSDSQLKTRDELRRIRDYAMDIVWSNKSSIDIDNYNHLKDSTALTYADARPLIIDILDDVHEEMILLEKRITTTRQNQNTPSGIPETVNSSQSAEAVPNGGSADTDITKSKKVWVIHGRNAKLAQDVFSFLRAIGLDPIEWEEARSLTGASSPYIRDILKAGFDYPQAFIVLLTGDDEAKLREEHIKQSDPDYERRLTPQARPNVLFEAGMAFGRQHDKVIFVQHGNLRPFSDISGMHILELNNEPGTRMEFADRLKTAGCDIPDLTSKRDWLEIGNFEPPVQVIQSSSSEFKSQSTSKESQAVPTAEDLRERKIFEIKKRSKSLLVEEKINWDIERKSEPLSIKEAANILVMLDTDLRECRLSIDGIADDSSTSRLDKLIRDIRVLSRYQVYADGGESFKEFWRKGEDLFEEAERAIDYITAKP